MREGDDAYLRFQGVSGRTYFFQISMPDAELNEWLWLPEIRSGTGADLSLEIDGTGNRRFFRMKYTDQPVPEGKTAETADFDGDGLGNLAEISIHGTDPFDPDTDKDLLPDGFEVTHGLNPTLAGDAGTAFPGSDLTYLEAFQSGLQNHPDATLADLDGDSILNELDADPREFLIDWTRSRAVSNYVVIDLNMEPLESFSPPHGRLPVQAVLNDHGAVCREPDEGLDEKAPSVWNGTGFPVTWTALQDFISSEGNLHNFNDWSVSFNNAGETYHGLLLEDSFNNVQGIQTLTTKWSAVDSSPVLYGSHPYETHVRRLVESRYDQLAMDEDIDGVTSGRIISVMPGGFSTSGSGTETPVLRPFNFYSYAPDVTRTGKILIERNGQYSVNGTPVPSNYVYGLSADPHGNDLIVTTPSLSSFDISTQRHRNGEWEKMPMPAIMDMNADGTGITFPEHQVWANGTTTQLDDLLSESGWSEFKAEQINADGVILGSAKPVGGTHHKAVLMVPIRIAAHKRGTINTPGMEQPAGNGEYGYETVMMENADSEDNVVGERDCDTEAVDKVKDDDLVKIILHYPGPVIEGASLELRHQGMAVDAKVKASEMDDPADAIEVLETGSRITFYDKDGNKLDPATDLGIANMANPGSGYFAGILNPVNDGRLTLFIEGADHFGLVGPPLEPVEYGYDDTTVPDAKAAAKKLGGALLTLALKMGEQEAETSLLVYRGGFLAFKQPKDSPGTAAHLEFWDGKGRIRHEFGGHENEFKKDDTDWGNKLQSWSAKSGKTSGGDYNISKKNGYAPPGWWITYERTDLNASQRDKAEGTGISKTITQGSYCRWEQDDAAAEGRYTNGYNYYASKPKDAALGEPSSISFKFELVPLPPSSGQNRTDIQLHPDGRKDGTAGCIGIQKYQDCLEVRYVMRSFSNLKIKVESK